MNVICMDSASGGVSPEGLPECLDHARQTKSGTVRLPADVRVEQTANLISTTMKYYQFDKDFQRFHNYRFVLLFRPATEEETQEIIDGGMVRMGISFLGDLVFTYGAGAPLAPITAPLAFVYESVSEDFAYQDFKRDALARGLPMPTRRGDAIVSAQYQDRYEGYWDYLTGGDDSEQEKEMPEIFIVEECFLEKPTPQEIVSMAERRADKNH